MGKFRLYSKFRPTGDQPQAIDKLAKSINQHRRFQTLLGVTGSGKTFTLACAIEKIQRPTLVISHNKTLAAQLYSEFKEFFPKNSVEYFISYYDYYQPESYIPQTDTYIEKDASINDKIDRLRLSATSSLMSRSDVIVVASVSCIYNLGSPQDYQNLMLYLELDQFINQEDLIERLVQMQYERNKVELKRGAFQVRGDTIDIHPAYWEKGVRVQFFGDQIERISEIDLVTRKPFTELESLALYPAKHFVIGSDKIDRAITTITWELQQQLKKLNKEGKHLEAHRLKSRTLYDMEMLKEVGYCHGIENYSRHISGRPPHSRPYCLLDYFPENFLTIIDESHVTIPQIKGMYHGDKARKETLIKYGFRLPSCLDNRPLKIDEFFANTGQITFVSATPKKFEIDKSGGITAEQVIRPTGLPDPEIEVRGSREQIPDLLKEIQARVKANQRIIVTTLTKKMSEQLTTYLKKKQVKVSYLHSEIDALERAKILKDLRLKNIDCVVGVNLLREGIDLPEVSLVVILDADKEGFLRSATSLIQVAGRCARNVNGKVIMYADRITPSMRVAIDESSRRRKIQLQYNKKYNITPKTIKKNINEGIEKYIKEVHRIEKRLDIEVEASEKKEIIHYLEQEMELAAKNLHFEKAAEIRDKIQKIKES
jgi:excinuclease ABC subunit B